MCGCSLDNSFNFAVCSKYFRIRYWDLCPVIPTGKPIFSHPDKQEAPQIQRTHAQVCPLPQKWFISLSFFLGSRFSFSRPESWKLPEIPPSNHWVPRFILGWPTILLVYPRLRGFLGCGTSYAKIRKVPSTLGWVGPPTSYFCLLNMFSLSKLPLP